MDILDKAIIFATKNHGGTTRKGGDIPYIVHPLEAGIIASSITSDREIISAAILHDILEDTLVTSDELEKEFGERITQLVLSDTENKRNDIPAKDSWQIRKQETLDFLIHAGKDEQIICLSDKLSNMRAIYHDYNKFGDKLWQRFNIKDKQRQSWYYSGIADRLDKINDTDAWKEYQYLIIKVFGGKTK